MPPRLQLAIIAMNRFFLLVLLALSPIFPAYAQEEKQSEENQGPPGPPASIGDSVFTGDWVTVGIGVGVSPSYEGSDDYSVFPAPLILGSVEGFDFGARGPGLYVDLVRDGNSDSDTKFVFGPQFRIRGNRVNDVDDPVVELLEELDTAVEVGFTSGISFNKVLIPVDSLTFGLDATWDVAGAHKGRIISPSIAYSTPLSLAAFARLSVSADHVDDNYADYYYSIDGADSAASGLPTFTATSGFKSVGTTLLLGYDLSGNALDGGFSVFAIGIYSSLLGDAKRAPTTSIRGDADQWFVAGGVSFTF